MKRLKRLGMFSLRHKRFRDDMIKMFKMIHSIGKVNQGNLFFCMDEDRRTREHGFYLKIKRYVNSYIGVKIFIRKVINYWNQLSAVVVDCISLNNFMTRLLR